MCKRVFIDANIFIDSKDDSRDLEDKSSQVLMYLLQNGVKIYTSCDLITTIYYILSKKDRLEALSYIEDINKICTIIEFSNAEVAQTCKLMRENPKFKDLEDTIQYILAKKQNCDLIISNDKNFASEDIKLLTPSKFLETFV